MALCDCGAESLRTTSTLNGKTWTTICPQCTPESFTEKVTAPSDKKLWMGWETNAAHYKKTDDGYQASDSVLADLEAAVCAQPEQDPRMTKALAERREYARTRRKAETEEERRRNDAAAKEIVCSAEREASLASMGIVLPENL